MFEQTHNRFAALNTHKIIKHNNKQINCVVPTSNNHVECNISNKSNKTIIKSHNSNNIGTTKLNSNWTLTFHHNPSIWTINGYQQIATFDTVDSYLDIMLYLDRVANINSINLCFFRKGITPLWEDNANRNGGHWSMKLNMEQGFTVWKSLTHKLICESLLKTIVEPDINGYINGITISNKIVNNESIIKIWVSDRKISNTSLICTDIMNECILPFIKSKIIFQVISPEK